jgi:hypothetical protein
MALSKDIQDYKFRLTDTKSFTYEGCPTGCHHVERFGLILRVNHEHPGTTRIVASLLKAKDAITPYSLGSVKLYIQNISWLRFMAQHILAQGYSIGDIECKKALTRLGRAKHHDHARLGNQPIY